ncbi:MAG TPA: hypothetical protein ENH21_02125, partial [Chromatiales bacterium]|nr:hypothetical protein [Chromatiales bacterium]HEX22210.1 hypothetical protein [Chromatiales bacterium]
MGFVNVLGRDGGENGLMGRVVNYGAVIMLSLVTVAPGLSHALFVLLSLVGMVARMPFGSGLKRLPIEVWAVVLVFLVSLAVSLLFIVMGGELPRLGWRKLEDLFWLILLVPSWYLFREYLSVKAMALGVAVGALVSGAWAIWEVLNHGVGYRAVGMTGKPIVFGILSMGLATMAFGLSFCFVERRSVQVLMWCVAVL